MQLKNENSWLKELVTRRQDSFEGDKGGEGKDGKVVHPDERKGGTVKKGVGTAMVE